MDRRPIGIFDSGVGGLTVLAELEKLLPGESMVYLGDTARVPYGTKSEETVLRYAREAARFLKSKNVKLLVVACNTASSIAVRAMADEAHVPVVGVIVPGARRAVEWTTGGKIGVIGTRATIDSGAYLRAIRALLPGAKVVARACPLFVPLAEEGWTDNEVAQKTAETYLAPIREAGVDTLVLGCTHYPLLKPVIAEVMGNNVALVDSAEAVAEKVRATLDKQDLASGIGSDATVERRFCLTDGTGNFRKVAERFLGRPLGLLESVRIEQHAP